MDPLPSLKSQPRSCLWLNPLGGLGDVGQDTLRGLPAPRDAQDPGSLLCRRTDRGQSAGAGWEDEPGKGWRAGAEPSVPGSVRARKGYEAELAVGWLPREDWGPWGCLVISCSRGCAGSSVSRGRALGSERRGQRCKARFQSCCASTGVSPRDLVPLLTRAKVGTDSE